MESRSGKGASKAASRNRAATLVVWTILAAVVPVRAGVERPTSIETRTAVNEREITVQWSAPASGDPPSGYMYEMFRCTAFELTGANRCNSGYVMIPLTLDTFVPTASCTGEDGSCSRVFQTGAPRSQDPILGPGRAARADGGRVTRTRVHPLSR